MNLDEIERIGFQIADNNASILSYWNVDLVCRYANKAHIEWFGLQPHEMIGKLTLSEILPPENFENNLPYFEKVLNGEQQQFEKSLVTPKGAVKFVSVLLTPNVLDKATIGFFCHLTDISHLKKLENAELEIEKSRRFYEFSSKINDLVLHAKTAGEIFSAVCSIAVDAGKFVFTWLGVADESTGSIKVIEWAGEEAGYLDVMKHIPMELQPGGKCPIGKAFREGTHFYCNDIANDPDSELWREEALKRGFHSCISLPVMQEDKVVAIFKIYAGQPFFFNEEETQLLLRVTANISYALTRFAKEQQQRDIETQLQKVMQAVEHSLASVVITDIKGDIEYVNPAFTKLTGYSYEEVIGQNPRILKSGYTSAEEYKSIFENLINKKEWQGEFCNRKKNGDTYWEWVNMSPVINKEGQITHYVAIKEDITAKKKLEEEQKRLISILESSNAFIATVDANKNFIWANRAMLDLLEIDDDITRYNVRSVSAKEDFDTDVAAVNEVLFKTGKWTGENLFRSKTGKETPVLQVLVLHKNEIGEMTHISTAAIDLTRIKEAEKELLRMNNELRDFSRHLQYIAEIEKNNILHELHDDLGQGLVSLKLDAYAVKMHLNDDKQILVKKIEHLLDSIDDKVAAFSRIYNSVNPTMLKDLGLFSAIETQVHLFRKSGAAIIQFISNMEHENIDQPVSLALFRIIQEGLSNIRRHAKAANCSISLMKEGGTILLTIQDDGAGFDIAAIDSRIQHGILSMRERAYAINGKFNIQSAIDKGTIIKVEVDL